MSEKQTVRPDHEVSAVVLAGGESRRLGTDKSLLLLNGQPLLSRTVQTLTALSDDLIVVTNHAFRYRSLALGVRFVADEQPRTGSLMGIYSGLKASCHHHSLVVACDMPFLNLSLLRYMISLASAYDVVIPRAKGLLEPLHALYGAACRSPMGQLLNEGERRIVAFFDKVRVRYVEDSEIDRFDPLHLSFFNVNTPEEWERAQALSAERSAR